MNMYFLAIFFPPLAVLMRGGFGQFLLNIILCLFGFFPGVIHAVFIVHNSNANDRSKKLEDIMLKTATLNMQTMQANNLKNQDK